MTLPTSTAPRLASSFQRAGAMGFDLMLLSFPEALLMFAFGPESGISILGRFFIYAAYFTWFESSPWQATPGKRIFKIYLARRGGTPLTRAQALERFLVFMVFTFPAQLSMFSQGSAALLTVWIFLIWLVPILATPERTGVHDMICGTRVWIGVKGERN
jgi:uncharacterized RDD family membrane protein YckC